VIVGEAGTGSEALTLAKSTRPHVVLMDLAMPGNGGIEATRRIVALGLGIKVLVLTALPQETQLWDALEAGASGFMLKIATGDECRGRLKVLLGLSHRPELVRFALRTGLLAEPSA